MHLWNRGRHSEPVERMHAERSVVMRVVGFGLAHAAADPTHAWHRAPTSVPLVMRANH